MGWNATGNSDCLAILAAYQVSNDLLGVVSHTYSRIFADSDVDV